MCGVNYFPSHARARAREREREREGDKSLSTFRIDITEFDTMASATMITAIIVRSYGRKNERYVICADQTAANERNVLSRVRGNRKSIRGDYFTRLGT